MKFADSIFHAGGEISGKMEMECKTDKGLGIGIIMVELFAIEGSCVQLIKYSSVMTLSQKLHPEIILLHLHSCTADVSSRVQGYLHQMLYIQSQ